jgi:hypothetical protein
MTGRALDVTLQNCTSGETCVGREVLVVLSLILNGIGGAFDFLPLNDQAAAASTTNVIRKSRASHYQ